MAISDFPFQRDSRPAESGSEQRCLVPTGAKHRGDARVHIRALAQQAASELRGLIVERARLTKRVAELRGVVGRLVKLYSPENVPSANSNCEHLPFTQKPVKFHAGPALQRACRIALMEIGSPAAAGDIYERIIRRGSFEFDQTGPPLASVVSALNCLVRKGDAMTAQNGARPCWQSASAAQPYLPESKSDLVS
jgi:hypothetical protein